MTTIEELTEERDRLYQEHNDAFQAWMDAEAELKVAIEEEAALERDASRARKYAFLTGLAIVGAGLMVNWIIV
uniref:Uncharacterized protein n=1 Tax=viral metagenome TaxID=1070528 RepID=A0A6C0CFA9_9ZZZZ